MKGEKRAGGRGGGREREEGGREKSVSRVSRGREAEKWPELIKTEQQQQQQDQEQQQ